ncbi:MAG: DUF481 domain-containing protein [Planctomycetota bacterium]
MRLLKTVPILFLLAACASVPAEDPAQPIPKANSEESAPPAKGEAPAKTAPPEAPGTKAGPTVAPWKPPVPGSDKFDWVQLKSGEWLKGEIQVMRKESLEFESDELDTLNLDWEDVLEVRSPRNMTVTFDGHVEASGTLLIREKRVLIGDQEFQKKALISIVPGADGKRAHWSGKLSFGMTARSGNTDQTDITSTIFARRRTAFSRVEIQHLANFGTVSGKDTIDNNRFTAKWDIFLSRKWYVTPFSFEGFRDPFQNIELRTTPGAGGGYSLIDKGKLTWELQAGAAWRRTEFVSVQPGEDEIDSTGAITFGTVFEMDVTKKVEFRLDYNVQMGVPDTTDTNQHFLATFSIDIIDDLDLDITFNWDHVGKPREDAQGNTPDKDDFRMSLALGWDF